MKGEAIASVSLPSKSAGLSLRLIVCSNKFEFTPLAGWDLLGFFPAWRAIFATQSTVSTVVNVPEVVSELKALYPAVFVTNAIMQ